MRLIVVAVVVVAMVFVSGGRPAHADIDALLTATNWSNVTATFHAYYNTATGVLTYTCVMYMGGPCPGAGTPGYWISTFYNGNAANFLATGSPGIWTSIVPLATATLGFGAFAIEQDAPLGSIPLNVPVAFQFAGPNHPQDSDFQPNSAGNRFAVHAKTEQDCESEVAEQHEQGSDETANAKCTGKTTDSN